jgi:chromosome segregation ATPase
MGMVTMMTNENNELLLERVVTLETEKKAIEKEIREIKETHSKNITELKEQIQNITTIQTQLDSSNQIILNELKHINTNIENVQKNVTEEMKPIKEYIEDLKTQPKKKLDDFFWKLATNLIWAVIAAYLAFKK